MRISMLAFLLFFQSLAACQEMPPQAEVYGDSSFTGAQPCAAPASADVLFQSTDGGLTWQNISAGLPTDKPVDCFYAKNEELVLSFGRQLFHSQSRLAMPVWEQETLLNGRISGIFRGRAGLYTVSYPNGFFQKVASGLWLPAFSGLGHKSFRTLFESANGSLFVGCDEGIFKSADGGKTWKHVVKEGWMLKMVESEGVLLCTSQQGILRSADGGENWEVVVAEGGVGIDVAVVAGGFAEISYNTASQTRRMRISEDGGKTWQPIDAGLPPQASMSGIRQVGEFLVCGHPNGIMRSADRGKTWHLVLPSLGKKVFNLSVSGSVVYAVPMDAGC